jgi:hypothetical protein
MVLAVSVFLAPAALLQPGYDSDELRAERAILPILAEVVLAVGGWLGGTVVFVHGERVLDLVEVRASRAVCPRCPSTSRVEKRAASKSLSSDGRSTMTLMGS